jgi:cellulose synthase (UDP-forming)
MVLLRHGYVTRYLGERLAVGLAPESLGAYFVQRSRWARGAIQAMYLRDGPLGPGLRLIPRMTFLPLHWISQSLVYTAAMLTPPIYLLTGMAPLLNASTPTVLHYQIPAIVGAVMVVRLFAQSSFVPLAQAAHAVLQAFRLLPVVLGTLIKPHGHVFKVTPKGADAQGRMLDRPTLLVARGCLPRPDWGFC